MNILKQAVRKLPGYARLRAWMRQFGIKYCRGVHGTFAEARAAIPSWRWVGYDTPVTDRMYIHRLDVIRPSEYAVFYWLGPLLAQAGAIFDFGGNIGLSYYAFQKYLRYPEGLRWLVCDVPAVVASGRALAAERGAVALDFTTEFSAADGMDILFTSGALQFVEEELSVLLASLPRPPRHLLINCVPLSEWPTFYTVHDNGPVCCPYRIANRGAFIESLTRLGYTLVDSWPCAELGCRILFHPRRSVPAYTGMYFRLDEPLSWKVTHST
jgi:putative methyltransferase (TIGR04325 family)